MVNPIKSHQTTIFPWFSYGFPMVLPSNQLLDHTMLHLSHLRVQIAPHGAGQQQWPRMSVATLSLRKQAGRGLLTLWLCQHSFGKWPFIVDFPIENGGSFYSYVKSPEATWWIIPRIPSGKRLQKANWKDPPFWMGKSTISMAIFNSYVKLPE